MTYDLYIADQMYSSWSLRGWLMLEKFAIPYHQHMVGLYKGTMADDMAPVFPARLVPAIRTPEGTVVGESMAIAETLAERHPDAGHWPSDPDNRATARWLCAEMASGMAALRSDCAMQLQRCYKGFVPSDAVQADLARIELIWAHARKTSGAEAGWLFGEYCLADVFYTPVAARIVGYQLPVSDASKEYCELLLSDPAVLKWRAAGEHVVYDPEPYPVDLPSTPWPYQ